MNDCINPILRKEWLNFGDCMNDCINPILRKEWLNFGDCMNDCINPILRKEWLNFGDCMNDCINPILRKEWLNFGDCMNDSKKQKNKKSWWSKTDHLYQQNPNILVRLLKNCLFCKKKALTLTLSKYSWKLKIVKYILKFDSMMISMNVKILDIYLHLNYMF